MQNSDHVELDPESFQNGGSRVKISYPSMMAAEAMVISDSGIVSPFLRRVAEISPACCQIFLLAFTKGRDSKLLLTSRASSWDLMPWSISVLRRAASPLLFRFA